MPIEIVTIETPGLGDRSYVVHDGEVAVVVDPQRDVDRVIARTSELGLRVTHVCETHVHNDYVSGGLALARRTGAELVAARGSGLSFDHQAVDDGDEVSTGSLVLRVVHTPGHTHHHVSYVVGERGAAQPEAVFTGGSLLYGTVGRTDLVGPEATEELTRAQWHSVRRLVGELPDGVAVHPTHGFGSFCSSQGGAARDQGTIGDERAENLAMTVGDVDRFVSELLAGLSEHPAYYAHMSLLNRAGPLEPDLGPATPVEPDELRDRLRAGEWVLDLRDRRAYAAGHLVGTAGFELAGPFVTYVGWLIPWGARITLVGETGEAVEDAMRELSRIGIDRPAAAVGAIGELAGDHPVDAYPVRTFTDLADAVQAGDPLAVVDVRRADEWNGGHVRGAVNIPIHELLDHVHHVPAATLWVHCASGARAAIAASLLDRAGHDVVLVDDDIDAAGAAGLTIEDGSG